MKLQMGRCLLWLTDFMESVKVVNKDGVFVPYLGRSLRNYARIVGYDGPTRVARIRPRLSHLHEKTRRRG